MQKSNQGECIPDHLPNRAEDVIPSSGYISELKFEVGGHKTSGLEGVPPVVSWELPMQYDELNLARAIGCTDVVYVGGLLKR